MSWLKWFASFAFRKSVSRLGFRRFFLPCGLGGIIKLSCRSAKAKLDSEVVDDRPVVALR